MTEATAPALGLPGEHLPFWAAQVSRRGVRLPNPFSPWLIKVPFETAPPLSGRRYLELFSSPPTSGLREESWGSRGRLPCMKFLETEQA